MGQVLSGGNLYHMVSDKTVDSPAPPSSNAFKIFLVCSFVLLGRPQDLLTFLQPMRPALVLTVLAVCAMVLGARRQELADALSTAESKRYLLFYLIMIIGVPFAYYRRGAFEGVFENYIVNMLFFVLVVSQVTSLQRLKSLIWVVCLCTAMYSVFGGLLQTGSSGGGRFEIAGNVFDPNDTAYLLLSLFPLCFYFVRFNEGLLKRLVALAAVVSSVAIILQTGSRGGILGLGTVLLIALLSKTGGIEKGYKIFLIVILASAWLLMRDRIDLGRYLTLFDISSDYNISSQGGRLELWEAAIDLSLHNPITGVGVTCFSYAHFLSRELAGDPYRQYHAVHNSFLQIAAEVGLIGFFIFLLINLRSAITFLRVSRIPSQLQLPKTGELRALGGLMLLGFAGLVVSGFFLSQAYSVVYTLYFALAAVVVRLQQENSDGIEATSAAHDTHTVPAWRNSGKVGRT
jgi:O-antigen ligase